MTNTIHHGYNNNFPDVGDTIHAQGNPNVPYKSSMFDVAHDYGFSTAFYSGKSNRIFVCEQSYNAANGAPDLIGADNGRDKIDFSGLTGYSGNNVSNEVNLVITNLSSPAPKHYSFIHIPEPDLTGHSSGWGSVNWSNAVRMVDTQLGRIINAINSNPLLSNQTALIVTADHGGLGTTHTDSTLSTNYTIPFFLRAPGIPGGTNLYALFSNRGDPGSNRTGYSTQPQPIRNSDGSNMALGMLGLPPIPGSFMVPVFAIPTVALSAARLDSRLGIFWPDPANEYVLEATPVLGPGAQWLAVTNGIATNETTRVLTLTNAPNAGPLYYRLRKL